MATLKDVKSVYWTLDINNSGEIVQGIEVIKQQIITILFMIIGSDPTEPDKGCGVFDHLDKPLNTVRAFIIKDVLDALVLWVPLIEVLKVTPNINAEGKVQVSIYFQFAGTTSINQVEVIYGV